MKTYWEFDVLTIIGITALAGLAAYLVAFEWLQMQETRRWLHRQMRTRAHPVYGPADLYRVLGPSAKKNLRLVNGGMR